jgi:haloalkane dehalogenase
MDNKPSFIEHYVPREQGRVYARDYKEGAGPAFALMHGFPDNLHIWDDLIPYLVAGGQRVVTFDLLGFGASDKPSGAIYSFKQQLGDLEAVVEVLALDKIVPVAHDSSGPAAINFAIEHPDRVDSVIMLNSAYAEDSAVLWPEMITLFATKSLQALAMAIAQTPEQFGWLLTWQQRKFLDALPDAQKPHFNTFLGPLISENFITQPSSGPAFVQPVLRNARASGGVRESSRWASRAQPVFELRQHRQFIKRALSTGLGEDVGFPARPSVRRRAP